MVSLGWYVLTAMLIVSAFAHNTQNDDNSLLEVLHLLNEHGNLINKITGDIVRREESTTLQPIYGDDEYGDDQPPNY